jgi:hypothetical protein
MTEPATDLVERYIGLGLALGRHIDGFVDAYYGPPDLKDRVDRQDPEDPDVLAERARRLLADLEVDRDLEPARRSWIAAQARGLHVTALKLAGGAITYLDEIEQSYGARPQPIDEEELEAAHRLLDSVLPGSGPVGERYAGWREAQVAPPDLLGPAISSLAEDLRERTARMFGLPDGERVEFELVTDKPWGGFNYYLGGLESRVAINTDLPVLSLVLGHLVAHEAYPGHHTEHSRKEAGLVRRRRLVEETIFLVGTPQCLLAEGLADLGLEVVLGPEPEPILQEHFQPLGIPYDAGTAAAARAAGPVLGAVRGNVAIGIHDGGWDADRAQQYLERWALLPLNRAAKVMQFLVDPTWSSYVFCYIDGYRLCRDYVAGDPGRFERLITEQMTPAQLVSR